jgi:fructose-1,6-bisphosphatase/inositol monophosphatase family enzyme
MLVAEGAVDIAAEPDVLLHDLAAPAVIVTRQAGGSPTCRDRTAGRWQPIANGLLHGEEVVARSQHREIRRRLKEIPVSILSLGRDREVSRLLGDVTDDQLKTVRRVRRHRSRPCSLRPPWA